MNVVLLCAAILVVFYTALSVNVSRMRLRGRARVSETQLTHAVRAHGNAAEYIPLIVALLLYLNSAAPSGFLSGVAVVATVSRFLHAAAMLIPLGASARKGLRFIGALGTYASLFALGLALIRLLA